MGGVPEQRDESRCNPEKYSGGSDTGKVSLVHSDSSILYHQHQLSDHDQG